MKTLPEKTTEDHLQWFIDYKSKNNEYDKITVEAEKDVLMKLPALNRQAVLCGGPIPSFGVGDAIRYGNFTFVVK